LDFQVQEYLKELRKHGLVINSAIVIATAQGIIITNMPICYHLMVLVLTTDWVKSLLSCMGFVKRKACSKAKVDVNYNS